QQSFALFRHFQDDGPAIGRVARPRDVPVFFEAIENSCQSGVADVSRPGERASRDRLQTMNDPQRGKLGAGDSMITLQQMRMNVGRPGDSSQGNNHLLFRCEMFLHAWPRLKKRTPRRSGELPPVNPTNYKYEL